MSQPVLGSAGAVARTVGGREELDDAIRAEGGSATLTPLDLRDYQGIYRLTPALNERYGKLDILVGNTAIAGVPSPLNVRLVRRGIFGLRLLGALFPCRRQRSMFWREQCAAETSSTAVRVNLFNPGPNRTRMRAISMPGEDPMKLPTPEQVAAKLVDLCLPTFSDDKGA